jgi:tetratricopeptide (TPR) repeat protein
LTIGSSNELMQEGIRHVREGRMGDAYKVFKKVIDRNPRNEFAWIWISVTSEDRAEKRAALEKALEINPNSQHAKEALRTLNAEETRPTPKPDPTDQPTAPMNVVTPPAPTPAIDSPATPAPLGQGEATSNPARFGKGESTSSPARIGNIKTNSRPNRINPQEIVSNPFYEMPPELAGKVASDKANADTRPYRVGRAENPSNPARPGSREANTSPQLQDVSTPVNLVSAANPTGKKKETVAAEDRAANTREKRERLFFRRIRLTALFILAILVVLLAAFYVFNLLQKQSSQATQTPPTALASLTAEATSSNADETARPTITVPPVTTAPPVTPDTTAGTASAPTAQPAINPALAAITKNLQAATDSQASGDYQAAITAYRAVIQADATNVPANLGLGTLYLTAPDSAIPGGTNRYAGAVQAFQVVTAQNPNWAGGYSHLGEALALQGKVKDAITAYSRSLELDPNGPERWLALAALYEKDNQPDQARFCRERAGSLAPTTAAPAPTATPVPTTAPPSTTTR